jgi:hypothetical protein
MNEVKHSIRMHVLLMNGATAELAVFLMKMIDLYEDDDLGRRTTEANTLAYIMVESMALHVQRQVDSKAHKDENFPKHVMSQSDGLLVMIGKSRGLPDKIAAKYAVLSEIAAVLRALGTYTKAKYPEFTTASGQVL